MNNSSNLSAATGRFLMAILFLLSGLGKIAAPAATQGFIASVGLPAPLVAYLGATTIEVAGGLLLLLGYRTRLVAVVLGAFTVLTAIFFHHNFGDQNQMIHFFKNIAITGGLLQIIAFGAGAYSLDSRRGIAPTGNFRTAAHVG